MYEKLALNVDELSMCDPCYHLIDEYLLTFFEDDTSPTFEPGITFLKCLPKNINNDSSFKLLIHYLLYYTPEFFHYYLEFAKLSTDVAKGEVPVG
jgi:hypothetical protein